MRINFLPFLSWFKNYDASKFRADAISGITVALVLIPQSMAYAQLAGLPPYYGLYAAFLPPMVAAMFGSSLQLATGPVAVVSLMTAATLESFATAGSVQYIEYAIVLALIVGIFQFLLGVLRLGLVVNFLSHPVVNGFTNAAAIIIATSQLSKLFGVYVDKAEHHYETIIRVIVAATSYIHWYTLFMGALAFGIMYGLRKWNPKIPNVLVAVAFTTVLSFATGFNNDYKAPINELPQEIQEQVTAFNHGLEENVKLGEARTELGGKLAEIKHEYGVHSKEYLVLQHENSLLNLEIEESKLSIGEARKAIRDMHLAKVTRENGAVAFIPKTKEQPGDGNIWRVKVGNKPLDTESITVAGGGDIVGTIPKGLPKIGIPQLSVSTFLKFLPYAIIISLLGFMEAISIAKAMAAKTGQRLDPNQELIGQGLGNILGAFGRSYPVSGSFSRSAVNLQAGAATGLSSVITSLAVVITLLFFTPLLYFLPQAVLAAVIMMAVIGLVNVHGFVHAWKAQPYDGIISVISFVATLAFAPHLDKGIMVGVVLSIGVFLYKSMRPKVATLALHPDHSLQDAAHFGLKECKHIAVIRFDGPLFFANASYLEDQVTERRNSMPELREILIVANGINEIDASGEEALSLLVSRLRSGGVEVSFSGMKDSVKASLHRTHLYEHIGKENFYPLQVQALEAIHARAHRGSDEKDCPLTTVVKLGKSVSLSEEELKSLSRVLLVDDEREFVENLRDRLKMRDFGANVAYDGQQALDQVNREIPDVMVLDLNMPEVDGYQVLQEVKESHPYVEVIILTGHGSQEDEERCMKLGAFAYLEKPIDIDELTKAMKSAYEKVNRRKTANQ
ncbi:Sulfate permease [Desulfatibacillum aliphaticivorans]|uniref:Sulfate permease n=1 Tax=Desulfatibacillum aliphaticivorans TaxID=218208 RepID=B8FBH7_DESAL|nr:SulP family inorganic anion transporter [Desulfatibacillum aliphaticivorans]ACL04621.1 Sulfate permease [Desulfatibacillum aliphaticivorans]